MILKTMEGTLEIMKGLKKKLCQHETKLGGMLIKPALRTSKKI